MKKFLWIILLNLFLCSNAFCEENLGSGMWLLQMCERGAKDSGSYFQGICTGFILGTVISNSINKSYCIPYDATFGQITRVIKKFLKDNPEKLHYSAIDLSVYAFQKAWP